jgi:hypothetical protein
MVNGSNSCRSCVFAYIRLSASPRSLPLFLPSPILASPGKTQILKRRSRFQREKRSIKAACKNGQYEEAIRQFSRAKQLDPNLIAARLYLVTTYASEYIPGAPSERNRQKR